jgi:tetratricopeptide (TPR) repeat protein
MENDKWKMIRVILSSIGLVVCLLVIWLNAQAGLSRLLAKYAMLNGSLDAADTSVRLASSDPEAHRVRAAVLYQLNQVPEAVKELEQAIALRPRDDYLWLELAMIKDELEDSAGALLAFDESVRLAPSMLIHVGNAETFCCGNVASKKRSQICDRPPPVTRHLFQT